MVTPYTFSGILLQAPTVMFLPFPGTETLTYIHCVSWASSFAGVTLLTLCVHGQSPYGRTPLVYLCAYQTCSISLKNLSICYCITSDSSMVSTHCNTTSWLERELILPPLTCSLEICLQMSWLSVLANMDPYPVYQLRDITSS